MMIPGRAEKMLTRILLAVALDVDLGHAACERRGLELLAQPQVLVQELGVVLRRRTSASARSCCTRGETVRMRLLAHVASYSSRSATWTVTWQYRCSRGNTRPIEAGAEPLQASGPGRPGCVVRTSFPASTPGDFCSRLATAERTSFSRSRGAALVRQPERSPAPAARPARAPMSATSRTFWARTLVVTQSSFALACLASLVGGALFLARAGVAAEGAGRARTRRACGRPCSR